MSALHIKHGQLISGFDGRPARACRDLVISAGLHGAGYFYRATDIAAITYRPSECYARQALPLHIAPSLSACRRFRRRPQRDAARREAWAQQGASTPGEINISGRESNVDA